MDGCSVSIVCFTRHARRNMHQLQEINKAAIKFDMCVINHKDLLIRSADKEE